MRCEPLWKKPAAVAFNLSRICGSIDVTEMIIGKWYDPISQRWIVPREARPVAAYSQSGAEKGLDSRKSGEAERIWDLLVDCCASGSSG
jgi:hypothetical protein